MKEKLMLLAQQIKPLAQKVVSASPLPIGIAIGYFGHGPIGLVAQGALSLAKLLLKI